MRSNLARALHTAGLRLPGAAGAAAWPSPSHALLRTLGTFTGGGDNDRPGSGATASTAADDGAPPSTLPPTTSVDTFAMADALWPASRRQKAAAARIRRAVSAVLADPAAAGLRGPDVHTLTVRCGLALGGVRAGPDGRTAHILYDVTPGTEEAAETVLSGPLAGPLRSAVGRALGARRAPVLKWTPDRLGGSAAAVLAELDRLGLADDGGK